jgi:hypothetical protein
MESETEKLEAEIRRLHAFILRMAERLAAASEVLGQVAERVRNPYTLPRQRGDYRQTTFRD